MTKVIAGEPSARLKRGTMLRTLARARPRRPTGFDKACSSCSRGGGRSIWAEAPARFLQGVAGQQRSRKTKHSSRH